MQVAKLKRKMPSSIKRAYLTIHQARVVLPSITELWQNHAKRTLGFNTPRYLSMAVTWRCQSQCIACNISLSPLYPTEDELTLDEFDTFFQDRLIRKLTNIENTGGEPTLRPDIYDLIRLELKRFPNSHISMGTNCISWRKVLQIAEIVRDRPFHFSLSLDGLNEVHDIHRGVRGNFDSVMRVVERLKEIQHDGGKLTFGFSVTVSSFNFRHIRDVFKPWLDEHEFSYQFTPVIWTHYGQAHIRNPTQRKISEFHGEMRKEVAEWFSSLDWKYTYHEFGKYYAGEPWQYPRCHVLTFGSVELRSNGDLVLCMQKPITYGNIRDAPFSEIWNSPKVNAMRKWVKKCRGCYSPNMCDALNNSHFQGLDYKYVLEKINSPVAHLLAKTI